MTEETGNGYVTVRTFVVTLAVVITSTLGICGAVVAFVFEVHTESVHAGAMTVERYNQVRDAEVDAAQAHRKFVSDRLTRIETKLDRLSP